MVLVHSSSLAPLRHARAPLLTLTSDPSVDDLHSCFYLAQLEGRGPITCERLWAIGFPCTKQTGRQ
eukprot:jgi/Botrbrau1/14259/Bobra.113_2s0005.1